MRTLLVLFGLATNFIAFVIALFASLDLIWVAGGVRSFGDDFDPTRVVAAIGALAVATVLSALIFWQLKAPRHEQKPSAYESPLTWHQRLFVGLALRVLGGGWILLVVMGAFAYVLPQAFQGFVGALGSSATPGR